MGTQHYAYPSEPPNSGAIERLQRDQLAFCSTPILYIYAAQMFPNSTSTTSSKPAKHGNPGNRNRTGGGQEQVIPMQWCQVQQGGQHGGLNK